MNITYLTTAVQRAAQKLGYRFMAGERDYLPARVATLPAAYLLPPEFRSMEGRNGGKITYRLTLCLMAKSWNTPPEERVVQLERLENNALEIFTALSNEGRVLAVEELSFALTPKSLTTRGDIALTATANVLVVSE